MTEFYRTGKFEFMKDKFRDVIVKICVDTYKKQGLPLKKPEEKLKMLSELNVILVTKGFFIQDNFADHKPGYLREVP